MYPQVLVAGTFDTIHKGHEAVLSQAFAVGDFVTVALTSDEFVRKFRDVTQKIKPFTDRQKHLNDWLVSNDYGERSHIVAINDPYEPAASMDELDAIMVTGDNRSRGEEINKRRAAKGLPELTLVEVPLVPAQDRQPISSTRVRTGEIDTSGKLILPDALRPELVKPLGEVLVGDAIGTSIEKYRGSTVIAVGDITTKTLLTAGVVPNLAIVDFQVNRKPYTDLDAKFTELQLFRVQVVSGPGFIAREAVSLLQKWATHPQDREVMIVTGEEDLLALPAIAYAPSGSVVYYGQPEAAAWACGPTMREGMVEVVVTAGKQKEAAELLTKFSSS